MVELLFFPQIRDLANLPSVKLTFKEADELSPVQASEHAFSRSTESLWLAPEKEVSNRTDIPFFAFPALTDLSGRMLESALLLSQLVVFKSEIAFTSHITSVPTYLFGHL